jgi:hypothetical protein
MRRRALCAWLERSAAPSKPGIALTIALDQDRPLPLAHSTRTADELTVPIDLHERDLLAVTALARNCHATAPIQLKPRHAHLSPPHLVDAHLHDFYRSPFLTAANDNDQRYRDNRQAAADYFEHASSSLRIRRGRRRAPYTASTSATRPSVSI